MQRELRTSPAYDYRGQTPNYGQHPLELHFLVKGDAGALCFSVNSGWYIDRNQATIVPPPAYVNCSFHAHPVDPHFDESELKEHCDWLDGQPCIVHTPFGFTGARLDELRDGMVAKGFDWLWQELETIYKEINP